MDIKLLTSYLDNITNTCNNILNTISQLPTKEVVRFIAKEELSLALEKHNTDCPARKDYGNTVHDIGEIQGAVHAMRPSIFPQKKSAEATAKWVFRLLAPYIIGIILGALGAGTAISASYGNSGIAIKLNSYSSP